MNDDSLVKIMSSLGLNFNPAEQAIKSFEGRIASLNKQLFDMKALALQGAKEINAAFSGQLGQFRGSKVILDQFGQPLKTVQTEAKKATATVGDMSAAYMKSSRAAKEHASNVQNVAKQYSVLASELNRRVSWFATGGLFYGAINAAQAAVQSFTQVESTMNTISRVMQDATLNTKEYRDQLIQIGVEMGRNAEDVMNVATTWAYAGYNAKDTLELTKLSLLAMNTAEMNATQATQGLVAIMSQWGLTTKDLLPVLDKLNKVSDTNVISTADLINGLAKASATARQFGLSIDDTIAYLSIMKDTTGATGKELGNAFKSILSYTQRPSSLGLFESLGIDVYADKAKTQLKSVADIFDQIAAKWEGSSAKLQAGFINAANEAIGMNEELAKTLGIQKEWNDLQERDITSAAAGTYRRTYFQALITNLGNLKKVYDAIAQSAGYSNMEQKKYMETLQAKFNSLKAAATELAVAIGDAGLLGLLKGLTMGLTSAIAAFSQLDPALKNAIVNFTLAFAAIKAFKAVNNLFGFTEMATSIINAVKAQNLLNAAIKAGTINQAEATVIQNAWRAGMQATTLSTEAATVQTQLFGIAVKGTTVSMAALQALLGFGIPLAVAGITALVTAMSNVKSETDELTKKTNDLIDAYKRNQEVAAESSNSQLGEIEIAKRLVQELEAIKNGTADATTKKQQMSAVIDQLNAKIPNLKLAINSVTGELNVQTTAIYNNIEAYKQMLLVQASEKQASAAAESLIGLQSQKAALQKNLNDLQSQRADIEKRLQITPNNLRGYGFGPNASTDLIEIDRQISKVNESISQVDSSIADAEKKMQESFNLSNEYAAKYGKQVKTPTGTETGNLAPEFTEENLKALLNANKISLDEYIEKLKKIRDTEFEGYNKLSAEKLNEMLNNPVTAEKTKAYLSLENEIQGAIDKSGSKKYTTNEAYQAALAVLEHRKKIGQETAKQELNDLQIIGAKYKLSAQERMDLEERIYDAKQRILDENKKAEEDEQKAKENRLQNSINWINQEKEFGRLSAEETLAAWRRVLTKQKDYAEAVKEANKGVFDAYKDLLSEQMKEIEKAYNDRMDKIDAEAEKQKKVQQDIIDGIEAQEKALERSETSYSHEEKMADLQQQLAYWSVRTSEEARQKVLDIQKQIADEQHNYEVEKQKQSLEDQKQAAQDKIDQIEKEAEDQKKALKSMWTDIQDIFNDNNKNLIANAALTSEKVAAEYQKILDKIKEVMTSGQFVTTPEGTITLKGASEAQDSAQTATLNTQIKALAEKIVTLKYRFTQGDKTAAQEAVSIYTQLETLGSKGHDVATYLHNSGYEAAKEYYESLPAFHAGAQTLSYGVAMFKPGELIFPPDLSTKLETLISALYTRPIQQLQSPFTDNRREIKIDKFLNIEKNYNEDETDWGILSKQLGRAVIALGNK